MDEKGWSSQHDTTRHGTIGKGNRIAPLEAAVINPSSYKSRISKEESEGL
jgi:hypothetical protein